MAGQHVMCLVNASLVGAASSLVSGGNTENHSSMQRRNQLAT